MTATDERPLSQRINTWVQTIGIIVAAVWAGYEFAFKEIFRPAAAPVNVSVDLVLETTGTRVLSEGGKPLRAVTMRLAARNPSTRTVALLPSFFVVYGLDYSDGNAGFDQQIATQVVVANSGQFNERHTSMTKQTVVAAGNAFSDAYLNPGEVVTRSIVLHVPDGEYDVLDAAAVFPTARHGSLLTADWRYDAQSQIFDLTLYCTNKDGVRGEQIQPEVAQRDHELQQAWSRGQLALTEKTQS